MCSIRIHKDPTSDIGTLIKNMDITVDDNTNLATSPSSPLKHDKEVQTFNLQTIKTLRTVGTQTQQVELKHPIEKHPDDVNPVQHLKDHNYSLGQCNGHIMSQINDTGKQSTNHSIHF